MQHDLSSKVATYQLIQSQKQFLHALLPKGYGLRLKQSLMIDEKRGRIPKKMDEIYESEIYHKKHSNPKIQSEKQIVSISSLDVHEKASKNRSKHQNLFNQNQAPIISNIESIPVKSKQYLQSDSNAMKGNLKKKKNIPEDSFKQIPSLEKKFQGIQKEQKADKKPVRDKNKSKDRRVMNEKKKDEKDADKIEEKKQKQQSKPENQKSRENSAQIKDEIKFQNLSRAFNLPFLNQQNQRPIPSVQKQFCLKFLNKLKVHKSSWPFRQPVDPVSQGVPDYLEVIKEPMDIKTIEKKLLNNKYYHIGEFKGDINKIFLNSYKFNPRETNYFKLTIQLEQYYYQLLTECERDPGFILGPNFKKSISHKSEEEEEQDFIQKQDKNILKKKKSAASPLLSTPVDQQNSVKNKEKKLANPLSLGMSYKQKLDLSKRISQLSSEGLEGLLFVIYDSQDKNIGQDQMKFTINIDTLRDKTLIAILNFLQIDEKNSSKKNRKIKD